ncbi:hypothetical protein C8R43DRAFT_1235540 [Mycena crocata]|nr:hypothetical protein C8R43DRAFT_1235540 [Mycena crocata]
MQFSSKFTQLMAAAIYTLHVVAGPLGNLSVNSTFANLPAINIGTVSGLIGVSDGSTVAWVSGDNRCESSIVQEGSGNFCGIGFTLQVLPGRFDFEGCGGPVWVNQNGAFYANCQPFSESTGCFGTVKTTFTCAP